MSLSGICQGDYPKKIVYEGDTVVVLNIHQLKIINGTFVEKDRYEELSDTLKGKIEVQDSLLDVKDKIIEALKNKMDIRLDIIEQKDGIIASLKAKIKAKNKKIKRLQIQLYISTGVIVASGIVILVLAL